MDTINKSDIKLLYNHSENGVGVIARSKNGVGTLSIGIDSKGVFFSCTAPNTTVGNDVLESIKRGDLDSCSFGFAVANNGDIWQRMTSNLWKHVVNTIEFISDFSVVVSPAYLSTSVSARSIDKLKELENAELLEIDTKAEADERKKAEDLKAIEDAKLAKELEEKNKKFDIYYKGLKNKYLK